MPHGDRTAFQPIDQLWRWLGAIARVGATHASSDPLGSCKAPHPRDPRVRFFRALSLLDEKNEVGAQKELTAALAEHEILDRAFPDHKLEAGIRALLSELLLQQGNRDEARRAAQPACSVSDSSASKRLHELHLCD